MMRLTTELEQHRSAIHSKPLKRRPEHTTGREGAERHLLLQWTPRLVSVIWEARKAKLARGKEFVFATGKDGSHSPLALSWTSVVLNLLLRSALLACSSSNRSLQPCLDTSMGRPSMRLLSSVSYSFKLNTLRDISFCIPCYS
jgi:hypothetical protein